MTGKSKPAGDEKPPRTKSAKRSAKSDKPGSVKSTKPAKPAKKGKVVVRRWRKSDIPKVVECQRAAYPDYPDDEQYGTRKFGLQFATFPEGQFLAEIDGRVIGYATSLIVQLDGDDQFKYKYGEITGEGTFSTHEPAGDTLYGSDIAVHPDYRGKGVSQRLYVERRKLLRRLNLRRMLAFGRLTGFAAYQGKLTAQEYVDAVTEGQLKDPALNAHLRAGYRVLQVRLDLMRDPASLDYATLLELPNTRYRKAKRRIAAPLPGTHRRVRACAAQVLLRPMSSFEELREQVEFFVDATDTYHCHFLVLPELFTIQLVAGMPRDMPSKEAILHLAESTDDYIELMSGFARKRGMYIVGGTQPVVRDGNLYNVAHLFTPGGMVETQDKLHITPAERELWGIRPGEGLKVFDSTMGRFAIQVCYDIEFPEVTRLLTFAGAEMIAVPFSTDERHAYMRVRMSAHARAVENSVFLVLAGNAGNLPSRTYLLNYARSAIITPSDFGFPAGAVAAEADPNIETVAIADIDFGALAQQRELGSVRPLHDRRPDLYSLEARQPPTIVRLE